MRLPKIAGVKLVEAANAQRGRNWVSVMPTNLYGPNDNFDLETSHVLPALIRKFHEAKEARDAGSDASVTLWGTGSVRREFLHVDDAARACIELMESGATGLFNVGSGEDLPVRDLAALTASIVGYDGPVVWDSSRVPTELRASCSTRPASARLDGRRASRSRMESDPYTDGIVKPASPS